MYETEADLARLQELIDASFARSSEHLRSIMSPPRRLTARRLARDLTGIAVLNVATVTARGEPRISALDGHFLHARWYATTSGTSPKVGQLRRRPAISAAYTPRDGYGVFCHGTVRFLQQESGEYQALTEHCIQVYGQSPLEWAHGARRWWRAPGPAAGPGIHQHVDERVEPGVDVRGSPLSRPLMAWTAGPVQL